MFVADHGIQRIHRFISHRQRRTAKQQKEERSDDTIDAVLGNGFDHCTVDLRRLKLRSIPAHNPRQFYPALR